MISPEMVDHEDMKKEKPSGVEEGDETRRELG
jgi:hypothetical protein